MKSTHLLTFLAAEAAASNDSNRYKTNNPSFGTSPSRYPSQENQSAQATPFSRYTLSAISVRGGDDDQYASNFFYSEISSDSFESENDTFDGPYGMQDFPDPVVASSQVLYEGGLFVSSEHIGPDTILTDFVEDHRDSDDEDDDDDDDGHSSMLSNNSLRRSRVLADGSHSTRPRQQTSTKTSTAEVYIESEVRLQQKSATLFGVKPHTVFQRR
jgi:hypothetical protein